MAGLGVDSVCINTFISSYFFMQTNNINDKGKDRFKKPR
ncbi:hypothetical protein B488_01530 [Liberibacter crescens BT-1]|uniref:Uncharacterized protein n=1 Tax=Liberibacter crescens (strain BT-1) TaxID=1215343 RepID=L0EUU0_LIBCB|nr:hypothetical protein B488_01530 [Liberibacter crescens BT-1]